MTDTLHSDTLHSAEWLAARLGITVQRTYELARTGTIPTVRIGRQVRFDSATIEEWIRGGGQPLPGGWRK